MPRDRLPTVLRRLFRPPPRSGETQGTSDRDALGAALLREFDRRPHEAKSTPPRWPRLALATVAMALALGGACRVPAEYTVGMGARIGIILDDQALDGLDPQAIVHYVDELYPLQQLEASIERRTRAVGNDESATVTIRLDLVGDEIELKADALWDDLLDEFPNLHDAARMEEQQLEATVHGTLGGKLSHRWLDLRIDRHGVEEARRRLLDQLEREGLQGDAQVEIRQRPDGRREVEVRVRAEGSVPPPQ